MLKVLSVLGIMGILFKCRLRIGEESLQEGVRELT